MTRRLSDCPAAVKRSNVRETERKHRSSFVLILCISHSTPHILTTGSFRKPSVTLKVVTSSQLPSSCFSSSPLSSCHLLRLKYSSEGTLLRAVPLQTASLFRNQASRRAYTDHYTTHDFSLSDLQTNDGVRTLLNRVFRHSLDRLVSSLVQNLCQ